FATRVTLRTSTGNSNPSPERAALLNNWPPCSGISCPRETELCIASADARFTRTLVQFLTRTEVDALLAAPDQRTWFGRRDHAFLLLAAQTGLRVSEMTGRIRLCPPGVRGSQQKII